MLVDEDTSDGIVQWTVGQSDATSFSVGVFTHTINGAIPDCIADFDLGNRFDIFFGGANATGVITAIPRSRPAN